MIFLLFVFNTVLAQSDYVEKELVVVITSYNNKDWYKRNLDSVYCQKYKNYEVIYVDDCSTDGTGDLVEQYSIESGQSHRTTIIRSGMRQGALAHIYRAVHSCDDHKIILQTDGDDWFVHDQVFTRINQEYQNPNVWMTYGQFRYYPSGAIGWSQDYPRHCIKFNLYRKHSWVACQIRTFYAGLFKKIRYEDCLYKGEFFRMACDKVFMYPMLEMSGGRFKFISDVLYEYNRMNAINNDKVDKAYQVMLAEFIKWMPPYAPLGISEVTWI